MRRKLLLLAAVVAILGVCWYFGRRHVSLDALAAQEVRLRGLLDEHPLASFLVGLVAYVALSFLPPTAGKSLVFGWLFGLWQGVVLTNLGLTITAVLTFLLSRNLLREGLRSRFGFTMARLDRAIAVDGAFYVFALRMMHAPYSFLNYALGTTSLDTRSFWWATQLGMLPGNIVFVYAGTQLPTLREAADRGWTDLVSAQLVAALVLVGVFPLLARWVTRRVWRRVGHVRDIEDVDVPPPGGDPAERTP